MRSGQVANAVSTIESRRAPWRLLLAEKFDDLLRRNGAPAQHPPGAVLTGEIDDRGRHVARRRATINDQRHAVTELIAHLLGAGALRRSMQIRRCGGNRL